MWVHLLTNYKHVPPSRTLLVQKVQIETCIQAHSHATPCTLNVWCRQHQRIVAAPMPSRPSPPKPMQSLAPMRSAPLPCPPLCAAPQHLSGPQAAAGRRLLRAGRLLPVPCQHGPPRGFRHLLCGDLDVPRNGPAGDPGAACVNAGDHWRESRCGACFARSTQYAVPTRALAHSHVNSVSYTHACMPHSMLLCLAGTPGSTTKSGCTQTLKTCIVSEIVLCEARLRAGKPCSKSPVLYVLAFTCIHMHSLVREYHAHVCSFLNLVASISSYDAGYGAR